MFRVDAISLHGIKMKHMKWPSMELHSCQIMEQSKLIGVHDCTRKINYKYAIV
jgi:hypothetical protein